MSSAEFARSRRRLELTQRTLASWLSVSVKAVQAYEQGWRAVPTHVERQVYVLLAAQRGGRPAACWRVRGCVAERRATCAAWLLARGAHCWLITGASCEGRPARSWAEKIARCRQCEVFRRSVDPPTAAEPARRASESG